VNVIMPQMGESVNDGTVAAWHKKVGDEVKKDDVLFDVETDKAAIEVPSPADGVITEINATEGDTLEVGAIVCVIAVEGEVEEPTAETAKEPATEKSKDKKVVDRAAKTPAPSASSSTPSRSTAKPQSTPASKTNPLAAQPEAMLSPAVRRLVAENNLDVSQIAGTGKGGRLTRNDVAEFIRHGDAAASSKAPIPAADGRSFIPFDRIRKLTAAHMVMSKATSPHVLQAVEVDYHAVDAVRKDYGTAWKADKGFSLTYLPFISKAITIALTEFPRVNASVDGDGLQIHSLVNLGIAVDLNFEGLVVPVVKDCANKSVGDIAEGIKTLSTKARSKKLTPGDMSGATYSISNSGPFGTLITAPIISQPQVAIMSTDGIKKRPVVIESEQGDSIGIRPIGILAQSFDHRAFDGAYSASFLNRVRELLEQHDWSNEL